jgi:rod shape determining protein RodA
MSYIFSRKIMISDRKSIFLKALLFTVIPVAIIMLQPDLETSVIVFGIFLFIAINSEIPKKYFFYIFLIFLLSLPVAWELMHDYQRNRILSFIAPHEDYSGTSYNMTQAKITVGSGGIFGEGLSMGKQTQLSFLPEHHTDFAFSSLIEQFGFFGGAILIILYLAFFAVLFIKLLKLSDKTDYDSRYEFFYLLGFSFILISQAAINIGMNLGIVPIAGVTLPFVSYGGSSLITFMIGLALLP